MEKKRASIQIASILGLSMAVTSCMEVVDRGINAYPSPTPSRDSIPAEVLDRTHIVPLKDLDMILHEENILPEDITFDSQKVPLFPDSYGLSKDSVSAVSATSAISHGITPYMFRFPETTLYNLRDGENGRTYGYIVTLGDTQTENTHADPKIFRQIAVRDDSDSILLVYVSHGDSNTPRAAELNAQWYDPRSHARYTVFTHDEQDIQSVLSNLRLKILK